MNGILTGTGFDRAFVAMPAWRRVGPLGWAAFSRHADLGNGLIFYPLEAFGGMTFSVAAAVLLFRNPTGPRSARMPLCAAAGFAIGGLLFTVSDDGPGLDADKASSGHGFVNMADRLGAIGGTVRWLSAPGKGAEVRGSIPLVGPD